MSTHPLFHSQLSSQPARSFSRRRSGRCAATLGLLAAVVGLPACGESKAGDGAMATSLVPSDSASATNTPAATTSGGATHSGGPATAPSTPSNPPASASSGGNPPTPTESATAPSVSTPPAETSTDDATETDDTSSTDDTSADDTGAGGAGSTDDSSPDDAAPEPDSGTGGSSGDDPAGAAGAGNGPPEPTGTDERPWFSFFVTSLDGLLSLAPDPVNGFGGDLGGLSGADEICTTLARGTNPGDAKTWRAFLSTAGFDGNDPVDAIDRIGAGPWYDYNGRLLASNVEGLVPGVDGRPDGDPQLAEMFSDEYGEPMRPSEEIDNHDSLTGSGPDGRLFPTGDELATCSDWTNNTLRYEQPDNGGGGFGGGGEQGGVPVGHAWPRSENNGRNWVQDHTVNGCEPGVFIEWGAGAPPDNYTVGGGGGYGAFYCFALEAVAP